MSRSPKLAKTVTAPLRMRQLCDAAYRSKGHVGLILNELGLTLRVISQRLSILRTLGVGRLITLQDPAALGLEYQMTVLVRLRPASATQFSLFEHDVIADPTVAGAQRIAGDFDYRLSTFHRDWRDAAHWIRTLRQRADVGDIDAHNVQPVFGDDLPGLALRASAHHPERKS